MPRAIWSGSISFGLVNIPVKLYSAVSKKTVHFNQLDGRTKSRVRQKRVSSETGEEVPYEQIVKGYELASGAYVVVTDDELAALDPKALRTIEIDEFVDLGDIDPIYYDAPYYLAPDKAAKPYALLAQAMEQTGKVGIAHFVMRTKQYLAAVRPQQGRLLLSTMVYADEINDPAEIPELAELEHLELSERELAMAEQLIDSLSAEFEPEKFHDTYREAVLELIERKAAGEQVVAPAAAAEPDKVVDLMAALEASVAAAKQARSRHPTAHDGDTVPVAAGADLNGNGPASDHAPDAAAPSEAEAKAKSA
jgi:DNA end-binding protein Ku